MNVHPIVHFLNICTSSDSVAGLVHVAETVFKQRVIEMHSPRQDEHDIWVCDLCSWVHPAIGQLVNAYAPCEHLQLMALIYADRAGFEGEWLRTLNRIPDGSVGETPSSSD